MDIFSDLGYGAKEPGLGPQRYKRSSRIPGSAGHSSSKIDCAAPSFIN